jgi:hypothetical protein
MNVGYTPSIPLIPTNPYQSRPNGNPLILNTDYPEQSINRPATTLFDGNQSNRPIN